MEKLFDALDFLLALILLAVLLLTVLAALWSHLLVGTIILYSAGALVLFAGIALYAIFRPSRRSREHQDPLPKTKASDLRAIVGDDRGPTRDKDDERRAA